MKVPKILIGGVLIVAAGIVLPIVAVNVDRENSIPDTVAGVTVNVTEELDTAYTTNLSQLKLAADDAAEEVNPIRKNNADTVQINADYETLLATMEEFQNGTTIEDFHQDILDYSTEKANKPVPETLISDMNLITQQAITEFEDDVDAWTSAVDEENDRIGQIGITGTESSNDRITRLQKDMDLVFEFKIGECTNDPDASWGCYNAGDEFYTVTPSGLAVNDCNLRTTLAHEYRHYLQWTEGLMEGDTIQTREWLEADARDWQWHGGGC